MVCIDPIFPCAQPLPEIPNPAPALIKHIDDFVPWLLAAFALIVLLHSLISHFSRGHYAKKGRAK